MKNVLLVSENRALHRQIHSAFEQYQDWTVHVVSFSTKFYEVFMELNASIVLLDSHTVMPYTAILQQIRLCLWPCHVILLGSDSLSQSQAAHDVCVLGPSCLTADSLLDALVFADTHVRARQSEKTTPYAQLPCIALCPNCTLQLQHDSYALLIAVYVGDTLDLAQKAAQIALMFGTLGDPEALLIQSKRVMLCVRKGKMHCEHAIEAAKQRLIDTISAEFCFFMASDLTWYTLKDGFDALEKKSDACYFFKGVDVHLHEPIGAQSAVDAQLLQNTVIAIFKCLLMEKNELAHNQANRLYLKTLKASVDYKAIGCVRLCMALMDRVFCALLRLPAPQNGHYATVESEHLEIRQRIAAYARALKSRKVSQAARQAICLVLDEYPRVLLLDEVAERLQLTKMQASRLFAKEIGLHYLAFLHATRMNLVQCCLILTDKKVLEIARMAGYPDFHYFSKLFKKNMGCTAEQYRHSARAFAKSSTSRACLKTQVFDRNNIGGAQ